MKRFQPGDEVICRETGITGHIFNVIPTNPPTYGVMWDNLTATEEYAEALISQEPTVVPPKKGLDT